MAAVSGSSRPGERKTDPAGSRHCRSLHRTFAAGFLTPTLGDAYHRIHPLTSIYRAILLLWLLGTLGFLLLDRLPERWRRKLWLIPLILLPWLLFRGMTGALADSPYLSIQALHFGHFLTQTVAIVSLILLLFRPAMLDRYIAASRAFYVIPDSASS